MLSIIIIVFLALFMGNGGNEQNVSASAPPVRSIVLSSARSSAPSPAQPQKLSRTFFNYAIVNGDCESVPVYRRTPLVRGASFDFGFVEYFGEEEENLECDIRARKNLYTLDDLMTKKDSPRFDKSTKVYNL